MTRRGYTDQDARASALTKRELRTLAKRLARSEWDELRAVARALDKALAGEAFGTRHHEGDDYDPFRCARCVPELWVIYAVFVAFPSAATADLGLLAGMHGLSGDDVGAVHIDIMCGESVPPNVRYGWLTMRDRQYDELGTMRAELEPGCWYRDDFGRWVRDSDGPDPVSDPEITALLTLVGADHTRERHAFMSAHSPHSWLAADPALLDEIRFGSDPRKARTARRAALRKGFDSSWLI